MKAELYTIPPPFWLSLPLSGFPGHSLKTTVLGNLKALSSSKIPCVLWLRATSFLICYLFTSSTASCGMKELQTWDQSCCLWIPAHPTNYLYHLKQVASPL